MSRGTVGEGVRSCAAANPAVRSIPTAAACERNNNAMTPVHTKAPARNHRGSSYRPASAIPTANGTRSFRTGMRSSRSYIRDAFMDFPLLPVRMSEQRVDVFAYQNLDRRVLDDLFVLSVKDVFQYVFDALVALYVGAFRQ